MSVGFSSSSNCCEPMCKATSLSKKAKLGLVFGIGAAVVVIVVVAVVVGVVVTPEEQKRNTIPIDDAVEGKFSLNSIDARWIDDEWFSYIKDDAIYVSKCQREEKEEKEKEKEKEKEIL